MRAVVITTPGGPDSLQVQDVPAPVPGPGEVLIDVAAAGLNRADVLQRQGHYPVPAGASEYPGLEVSGRIAAVGDGVEGLPVGADVVALLTQAMQNAQSVNVGEHDVEHEGIRSEFARNIERLAPGVGGTDLPSLVAKRHLEKVSEAALVIDDENANRTAVRPLQGNGCRWQRRRFESAHISSITLFL